MHTAVRALAPLAVTAMAALPLALAPTAANAAKAGDASYMATLDAINGSGGSGMATVMLTGDRAQVKVEWSGLAQTFSGADYPHVQHIHIGAKGVCPTRAADTNGDGVISTTEGGPSYGGIGTTLSEKGDTSPDAGVDIKIAPSGSSTSYSRTITLSADTVSALEDGTGVVVVHGLDPSTLSKKAQNEKSDLVPSLPLAATSPALCGALTSMPTGGVDTGAGSTAGIEDTGVLTAGAGLLAVGAGVALVGARRRRYARIER